MINLVGLNECDYFLPEDGDVAKAKFLELIGMPTETWISAYGFNMKSVFDIITANDAKGVPYHLVLDYLQSEGPSAKPLIKAFNEAKKVSDVTLTTAGVNSQRTSQIWHWKGFVKAADDGGEPYCWEGSTNFSDTAWFQGNSCRVFRSQVWADQFRAQQAAHKAWALANHPAYQETILEVGSEIDAFFDSLEVELSPDMISAALQDPSLITPDFAKCALQELAKLRGL